MVSARLYRQYTEMKQGTAHIQSEADKKVEAITGLIEAPDPSKMRALIVVQDTALEEAQQKYFGKTRSAGNYLNNREQAARPGYREGVTAGRDMALNTLLK